MLIDNARAMSLDGAWYGTPLNILWAHTGCQANSIYSHES